MISGRPSFPNMTLLRQFIEVAEQQGIARAARNLNMTQPALSKNLRRLEASIGAELFDRHAKGTALTNAGRAFYQRSLKIILEYEHALQEVQNALTNDEGVLRIGAGPIFASTIIPAALPAFLERYPRYRVTIRTLTVESLGEELELGRIDLIASAILQRDNGNVVIDEIRRADLSILCGANHPLSARHGPIPAAEIAKYPFVSFEPDHDLIRKLALMLSDNGAPPPRYSVETSSIFGAIDLLRTGDHLLFGSALLCEYPIGHGLTRLKTEMNLGDYAMGFITRKDRETIPAYRGFMNIVRAKLLRAANLSIT